MKGIKLSENINYLPLNDEQGDFGLMMLTKDGEVVSQTTVESKDDFKLSFNRMMRKAASL